MNKKFKIATAAVSVVMAGTMAFGMFGCNNGGGGGGSSSTPTNPPAAGGSVYVGTDSNADNLVNAVKNKLNYSLYSGLCNTAYTRMTTGNWASGTETQTKITGEAGTDDVTLRFNVGDKNSRSISYVAEAKLIGSTGINGTNSLPDGSTASNGDLKPIWRSMQSKVSDITGLNVTFQDVYHLDSNKIKQATGSEKDTYPLTNYDLVTDGVQNITDNQSKLLDLSQYMDQMPDYQAFLTANPTVKDSLTSNGGGMYYAPYFDGYNDVEKYSLFKNNWVKALLDAETGDTTQTWAASMEAKGKTTNSVSIQSYMGTTGSWNTDVLDKDGEKVNGGITVNYDKALAAAKDENTPLGAAIKDAAGKVYAGPVAGEESAVGTPVEESGNIVDLLNFVICNKGGDVTGAKLLKVMQEYIKVAYYVGATDTAFYTQSGYKLSDVFAGNSAAWDVDLFAALGRIMITNPSLLKSGKVEAGATATTIGNGGTSIADTYLISAREKNMQRHSDIVSWVGELYGVRGLESRYAYAYIDKDGNWKDTRGESAAYRAMAAFSGFYKEGLLFIGEPSDGKKGKNSYCSTGTIETMTMHDYLNTQTPAGFVYEGITDATYNIEEGYDFTANLTAVSMWDEDGSGAIENDEYFRFTESWRSVKDSGIAVPYDSVKNNPTKLKAVLALINYMFSNDGQIMMAYGKPASDANGTGGFWYNPEVTNETVGADGSVTVGGTKYKGTFTFENKTYASNTEYGGGFVPTLTEKTLQAYVGQTVNGVNYGKAGAWNSTGVVASYTDFARGVMGSALNFGNKLTSLEYQMTCEMGRKGAEKVDNALTKDIIRHTSPLASYTFISESMKWYKIAPTSLPFTVAETDTNSGQLNTTCNELYNKGTADTVFSINKNSVSNLFLDIIQHKYDTSSYTGGIKTKLGLGE